MIKHAKKRTIEKVPFRTRFATYFKAEAGLVVLALLSAVLTFISLSI